MPRTPTRIITPPAPADQNTLSAGERRRIGAFLRAANNPYSASKRTIQSNPPPGCTLVELQRSYVTVEVRTLYLSILLEVQRGLDSLLSQLDSAGPPIPERFQHSVTPHENSKRGFTIGAYRALHDIRFSYGQADDCIHDLESALGKPHADKREIIRQLRCLENILVRLRWKWAWKGSWQPVYVETTGRCAPLKWPGIGDSSAGGAGGAGVQRSDLRGRG